MPYKDLILRRASYELMTILGKAGVREKFICLGRKPLPVTLFASACFIWKLWTRFVEGKHTLQIGYINK